MAKEDELLASLKAAVGRLIEPFPRVRIELENRGVAPTQVRSVEVRVLFCQAQPDSGNYFENTSDVDVYPRCAILIDVAKGVHTKTYDVQRRIDAAGGKFMFASTVAADRPCIVRIQFTFLTESQRISTQPVELKLNPVFGHRRYSYVDAVVEAITIQARAADASLESAPVRFLISQRSFPPNSLAAEENIAPLAGC